MAEPSDEYVVHDSRPTFPNAWTPVLWRFPTRPSRIYVGASLKGRVTALEVGFKLQNAGFRVVSRWLELAADGASGRRFNWADERSYSERLCATDCDDLRAADTLVLLTDVDSSSGGYHCELGFFLGAGKENIVAVGRERPNVFWHHLSVRWLPDAGRLVEFLGSDKHGA